MKDKDARSKSGKEQERIRINAVRDVLEKNKKQITVASDYGVTRQAVGKWIKKYRKGETLHRKEKGNPKLVSSLTKQQSKQIKDLIFDYTPDQLSLPFHLWNKEAVAQLIKQKLDKQISKSTVIRYLTSWDYLQRHPSPREITTETITKKTWYQENYFRILKTAKREKAKILWFYKNELGNELQFRIFSNSLSEREKDKLRMREYNTLYAITNRGRVYFLVYKNLLNIEVFLDFLNRLLNQVNCKIVLIMEPYGVSGDEKAQNWIKENKFKIRLVTTERRFFN